MSAAHDDDLERIFKADDAALRARVCGLVAWAQSRLKQLHADTLEHVYGFAHSPERVAARNVERDALEAVLLRLRGES